MGVGWGGRGAAGQFWTESPLDLCQSFSKDPQRLRLEKSHSDVFSVALFNPSFLLNINFKRSFVNDFIELHFSKHAVNRKCLESG